MNKPPSPVLDKSGQLTNWHAIDAWACDHHPVWARVSTPNADPRRVAVAMLLENLTLGAREEAARIYREKYADKAVAKATTGHRRLDREHARHGAVSLTRWVLLALAVACCWWAGVGHARGNPFGITAAAGLAAICFVVSALSVGRGGAE